MEKKAYMIPESEVVELQIKTTLLTVSTGEPEIHNEEPGEGFQPV